MKKFIVFLSLCTVFLCSGCKCDFTDSNDGMKNSVPTTVINTTYSSDDESELVTLYSNCKKSVVTILNYASYYDRGQVVTSLYSSGSGFVYAYDDNYIYLYSNAHVVSVDTGYNQSYYEVVFHDGYRSYASLAYSDGSEDVAIMKVEMDGQDFAVASLGNSDAVSPGEEVFTLGSPLGLVYSNTITKGIVSNVRVQENTDDDGDGVETTMYLIQIDAALNPGNSGGPLFNMKGEVIGVNTLKIMSDSSGEDVESFNFSIPINHFVMVANSLAENGSYSRPLMGVTVIDITSMSLKERDNYNIEVSKGLYIESVSSSGPSKGILSKGLVIVKINEVEVSDMADFSCELYKYHSGDTVNVVTTNGSGGNTTSYSITLS